MKKCKDDTRLGPYIVNMALDHIPANLSAGQFKGSHPDRGHLIPHDHQLAQWDVVNVVEIWKRDDGNELVHLEGRGWTLMYDDKKRHVLLPYDKHFAQKAKYFDYELKGKIDRSKDKVYEHKKELAECKCHSWNEDSHHH